MLPVSLMEIVDALQESGEMPSGYVHRTTGEVFVAFVELLQRTSRSP